MTDTLTSCLNRLGLTLPRPAAPIGSYQGSLLVNDILHVSMQGPVRDGRPAFVGRIGAELTVEQGREAAIIAVLHALAHIDAVIGTLDRLKTIIRFDG